MAVAVVLMGVAGCGKTSVGKRLSELLGWPFFDGDDFHPEQNIAKMSQGIPLDDNDRFIWLSVLHDLIEDHLQGGESMLVACLALKKRYRDQLREGNPGTVFVYLKGDYELIFRRLQDRESHYMKAEMLQSQFAAFEEPEEAVVVSIDQDLDSIVTEIEGELTT
jgi:gluconokinase